MELYWLLRIAALHDYFEVVALILTFTIVCCIIAYGAVSSDICWNERDEIRNEKSKNSLKKLIKYSFITIFISLFISTLLPSKQELALMLGWDAINSDSVQDVIDILKERLKG